MVASRRRPQSRDMTTLDPPRATVTTPLDTRTLEAGPLSVRIVLGAEHGAAFSVLEMRAAPGFAGPPVPHHHTREEACFHVLEGALVIALADGEHRVEAGGFVHLPREVDFTWRNARADAPARFLCVYAPAGLDRMFADAAAAFAARGEPPTPEAMRAVMPPLWAAYGIGIARR
jgi:mannose-6-phosphate isomerase-like protein (cupin superfamily)